jgi:hypothetical protein
MADHRASNRWGLQGEASSRQQARPPPVHDRAMSAGDQRLQGRIQGQEAMLAAEAPPSQKPQVLVCSAKAPEVTVMDCCNTLASKPQ